MIKRTLLLVALVAAVCLPASASNWINNNKFGMRIHQEGYISHLEIRNNMEYTSFKAEFLVKITAPDGRSKISDIVVEAGPHDVVDVGHFSINEAITGIKLIAFEETDSI